MRTLSSTAEKRGENIGRFGSTPFMANVPLCGGKAGDGPVTARLVDRDRPCR